MDSDIRSTTNGGWVEWARTHRSPLSVGAHIVLFAMSWFLAFGLVYNFQQFESWLTVFFLPMLAPVVLIKLTVFVVMGQHRGWWRYVGLRDLFSVTTAAWVSFIG